MEIIKAKRLSVSPLVARNVCAIQLFIKRDGHEKLCGASFFTIQISEYHELTHYNIYVRLISCNRALYRIDGLVWK